MIHSSQLVDRSNEVYIPALATETVFVSKTALMGRDLINEKDQGINSFTSTLSPHINGTTNFLFEGPLVTRDLALRGNIHIERIMADQLESKDLYTQRNKDKYLVHKMVDVKFHQLNHRKQIHTVSKYKRNRTRKHTRKYARKDTKEYTEKCSRTYTWRTFTVLHFTNHVFKI